MKRHEIDAVENALVARRFDPMADRVVAKNFGMSQEDVERIRRWRLKRELGSLEQPTELGDGGGTDDGTRFE